MSDLQNDVSLSQTWKSSGQLGTPDLSPATSNLQFMSQHATPQSFLEDQDLEDFSNYPAPASDEQFLLQFGPMLNLDDDEDSFRARDPVNQTSTAEPLSDTFIHQPANEYMQSFVSNTVENDVNADSGGVGPLLEPPAERQAGVNPTQRAELNQAPYPTLHEQEEQRQLKEKQADVEHWITNESTDANNENEDVLDDMIKSESSPSPPSGISTPRADSLHELPKGPSRFWHDLSVDAEPVPLKSQPSSSQAAIYRFEQRARDIETASRTATIGSRRRSLDSLVSVAGISIRVPRNEDNGHAKGLRRPSILQMVIPRRSNSNLKKRKGVEQTHSDSQETSRKDGASASRSRSPGLDTNLSPSRPILSPRSPISLAPPSNPWAHAKSVMRRNRSRTEADRPSLLASMWVQQGGPPVPTLRSPSNDAIASINSTTQYDSDKDAEGEDGDTANSGTSEPQKIPQSADYDGFKAHAQDLNPDLPFFMVERITQEQLRRYKKLVDFRIMHLNAVNEGHCSAGQRCIDLGGGPISPPVRNAGKNADATSGGFHIPANINLEEDGDQIGDGTTIAAHFPPGVPIPPVQLLPAEFECPLCFQVKLISKPSDWTKHVHEDVQPFTCTFQDCGEPKSFKRKADWVRHENERHRQLEKWVCNFQDCVHTCYRKDNFVQHLVREHKLPEPKIRGSRPAGSGGSIPGGSASSIQMLIQTCRHETTKQPKDEPCHFCGAICLTWKKLTVHLAKHMEALSMPVLKLVEGAQISKDSVLSPLEERSNSLMPIMPSPSGGSQLSGQSSKLSRSPQSSDIDRTNNFFNPHSGATYPPPNPSFASHHPTYKISIESTPIPNELLDYGYPSYNDVQASQNWPGDGDQNLLNPMDESNYYGSYGSSGSSNNASYEPEAPLQHFEVSNLTSNPNMMNSNPGAFSQQPIYTSPTDNTVMPFPYGVSQEYVPAPTSNGSSYPQYPIHSTELAGQSMDYQNSPQFVQHTTMYSGEQNRLSRLQGSTYPPQNFSMQRPTSQPPPLGRLSQQAGTYEPKDRYC